MILFLLFQINWKRIFKIMMLKHFSLGSFRNNIYYQKFKKKNHIDGKKFGVISQFRRAKITVIEMIKF